jgi:gluconokinase
MSTEVLCFDVASGGVSGARFDEQLNTVVHADARWSIETLTPAELLSTFRRIAEKLDTGSSPAAISITSFMHGFLIVDNDGDPISGIYTWRDSADASGLELIRNQFGDSFHERTGCRYHPMFPVFKLAGIRVSPSHRVVSPKAWLTGMLTRGWAEDDGMASASGLLNLNTGQWDNEILRAVKLPFGCLPQVLDRESVVGRFKGAPVINGSGDGFMATLGSGCDSPDRVATTLGTTGSARRLVRNPVLEPTAGTFCYRASRDGFLLGCASNNGGNVFDWARERFGAFNPDRSQDDVPIFLPMLYGERSPEWNPHLRASWQDVTSGTTLDAMKHAVREGVAFNLANYVEILQGSGEVRQVVLSGNGFREPGIASTLAAVVKADVLQPESFGLATLRGAAMNAWRGLGRDVSKVIEDMVRDAPRVNPVDDDGVLQRFARYKELRFG